jgi:hypothetical protein
MVTSIVNTIQISFFESCSPRLPAWQYSFACPGLPGLATYTAELRTKEIGIRKVLTALSIAVFTISFQSIKAALVNPAASLKRE